QVHTANDAAAHGSDAEHPILPVPGDAEDHGSTEERHEIQGQRGDGDDTSGRTDTPAAGEERGPVRQRARDETGGEERRTGDGGQREQGALEHEPEYGRSRDRRHPFSLRRHDRPDLSSYSP